MTYNVGDSQLPKISVITVTFNCEDVLRTCLGLLGVQDYPKEKLEYIIIDGGSTDDTLRVAEQFGARIVPAPEYQQNQEARRGIGLNAAKHEILAYIDSDNFITHTSWLREMVQPLLEEPNIIATQTLHYGFRREDSALNRYYGLIGTNDPVAYYMNKRDRISWAETGWTLPGTAEERDRYYIVSFKENEMPTMGCNGFLIRRNILLQADIRPEAFVHIDVLVDLIRLGYCTYGIVKNSIVHYSGSGLLSSFRKRLHYMQTYSIDGKTKRRYHVYDPHKLADNLRLMKYIVYSLTMLKPTYDALRGYSKVHDMAWFLHPVICLGTLIVYGAAKLSSPFRRQNRHRPT